jgi:7-cyano-7-deazaguanine synthase
VKTIVICSGGLDSVTLAHQMAQQRQLTALLSFNYGQRHKKELNFARVCAANLNVPHHVVDITHIGALLSGSALTDDIAVPDGHYTESNMKITVVPNRNAIMLTIAYGMAAAQKLDAVAAAFHGGDHFIYPDCRPDFVKSFANMQQHALEDVADIALHTPFLNLSKADIVKAGAAIGVPFTQTKPLSWHILTTRPIMMTVTSGKAPSKIINNKRVHNVSNFEKIYFLCLASNYVLAAHSPMWTLARA